METQGHSGPELTPLITRFGAGQEAHVSTKAIHFFKHHDLSFLKHGTGM